MEKNFKNIMVMACLRIPFSMNFSYIETSLLFSNTNRNAGF